jgi:predicted transcriptional regulator
VTLDDARAEFRGWLHLPDTGALDVVLGTIAANRLEGDPVWLLLVGPPGGGKSEILNAAYGLEDTHPTGTLTEASLLSGTPRRETASDAKGGLLRVIGDRGIIVCKDFGSVLSMNRDARAAVLGALREVYDGAWTRHVGTDGGRTLSWTGRVGLVGGCTPTIDRHHAVMGAMGERFTLYRLRDVDPDVQAREALRHSGRERAMRAELGEAVREVLSKLEKPRERTDGETDQLIGLATLVVRARSAVERDGYTREIELVPGSEAPTRLVIVLDRLLSGLDAIGCDRAEAFRVVTKAALDSIPALRLAVLDTLYAEDDLDTNTIAGAVLHPASTTRRALEDLTAHGLVTRRRGEGEKDPHRWSLAKFSRNRMDFLKPLETVFPEMSSNTRSGRYKADSPVPTIRKKQPGDEPALKRAG